MTSALGMVGKATLQGQGRGRGAYGCQSPALQSTCGHVPWMTSSQHERKPRSEGEKIETNMSSADEFE